MVVITGAGCDVTGGAIPRFPGNLVMLSSVLVVKLKTNWGQGLLPVWVGKSMRVLVTFRCFLVLTSCVYFHYSITTLGAVGIGTGRLIRQFVYVYYRKYTVVVLSLVLLRLKPVLTLID